MSEDLEQVIREMVVARDPGTTCPSEVARRVGSADGWRDLMPEVRAAARRLAERGEVQVTQGGEVVDVAEARGPVRIRRTRPDGSDGSEGGRPVGDPA